MKESQKVYIKGVPGRGAEVIKTLKDLGGKNCHVDGADPECLYFIGHKGSISLLLSDSEFGEIIADNYREIKLPERWKDGDILINKDGCYAVFMTRSYVMPGFFAAHIIVNNEKIIEYPKNAENLIYRLAAPHEITHFYRLLHKHHKDWDAEKKQLVGWQWKPEIHEDYFFVYTDLSVKRTSNDVLKIDEDRILCGNCFRTREEAIAMADKIKKLLKGE